MIGRVLTVCLLLPVFLLLNNWCLWIEGTGGSVLSAAEWIVAYVVPFNDLSERLQRNAWRHWKHLEQEQGEVLGIPTIDVQALQERGDENDLLQVVESVYGKDWKKRPLLLKNLWKADELANPARQLSMENLMKLDMPIAYYSNTSATGRDAGFPDSMGSLSEFLTKLNSGVHAKAVSRDIVHDRPHLLEEELAPPVVKSLFGNDTFTAERIGKGVTAVMFFRRRPCDKNDPNCTVSVYPSSTHAEPVNNLALQLQGVRYWKLTLPKYMFHLKPSSPHVPRGYVYADNDEMDNVPHWKVETHPGDALYVPAWTWHRVDYFHQTNSNPVVMGVGMFFFDPKAFFQNNPIMSLLLIPAMVRERRGYYAPEKQFQQIRATADQVSQ